MAAQDPNERDIDLEKLVDDYADVLFRYALLRVKQHDIAEDLVQETFIAAHLNLKDFQEKSSPSSWLIGILRHKISDHIRQSSRQLQQQDEDLAWMDRFFDDKGHWKNKPVDWKSDPAAILENKAFWQVFEDCLDNLSEPIAQAFVLRVMEEFAPAQVCKNLSITQSNLWSRLCRARIQLRQCLETNWFNV